MNDEVSWHVELLIKPGCLESFKSLSDEMVAFAGQENGVLIYQRFINKIYFAYGVLNPVGEQRGELHYSPLHTPKLRCPLQAAGIS